MLRTKSFSRAIMRLALTTCGTLVLSSVLPAATITGGMTTVALDSSTLSTLESLFTIGVVSPATLTTSLGGTVATFPITGGNTSTGIIDHSGGLTLTGKSTPMGVGTEVWAADYVINLNTMMLTGSVSVNNGAVTTGVPLFDIGTGDVLTVDKALAGDLTSLFGVPNLTGATVGTATVSPVTSATPEPASLALMALGLLAAFAYKYRGGLARMRV